MKSVSMVDIAKLNLFQFAKADMLIAQAQRAEKKHCLLPAMLLNCHEHQPLNIFFRNNASEILSVECAVIADRSEHREHFAWKQD